jgi:hypothetical protein
MDIPDFSNEIKQLEESVNNLSVTDDASFEKAKGYSQACNPVIRSLEAFIQKIKDTEKIINAKIDAYNKRKPSNKPATKPVEAPKETKPAQSLSLDGFDEEPLSESDEMAAEINKSMNALF